MDFLFKSFFCTYEICMYIYLCCIIILLLLPLPFCDFFGGNCAVVIWWGLLIRSTSQEHISQKEHFLLERAAKMKKKTNEEIHFCCFFLSVLQGFPACKFSTINHIFTIYHQRHKNVRKRFPQFQETPMLMPCAFFPKNFPKKMTHQEIG